MKTDLGQVDTILFLWKLPHGKYKCIYIIFNPKLVTEKNQAEKRTISQALFFIYFLKYNLNYIFFWKNIWASVWGLVYTKKYSIERRSWTQWPSLRCILQGLLKGGVKPMTDERLGHSKKRRWRRSGFQQKMKCHIGWYSLIKLCKGFVVWRVYIWLEIV